MALIKKLSKIGNSWGVILPADIMQLAGLEAEGDCEISIEESGVLLRPYFKNDRKDDQVMKAMSRFIRKYRNDLKKLA